MSSKNLVFSHQREVVLALSQFFETVEVFTTEPSSEYTPKNVKVSLLPWRVRSPLRNLLTVLRVVYPFLIKNRDSVLFTHMTDAHAAILAPLAWLIRIRHILWYALYTLDIFGRPANLESEKYFLNVRSSNQVKIQESSINFRGSIERALVSKVTENYDIFLNLFSGSLDKTLVEATFMGMPVVTWNLEYCSQFGTWSNFPASATLDFIIKEFEALDSMKNGALQGEIARRLNLAIKSHSFEGWIDRLVRVLKKGKLS